MVVEVMVIEVVIEVVDDVSCVGSGVVAGGAVGLFAGSGSGVHENR
jgi:hypothetical protein